MYQVRLTTTHYLGRTGSMLRHLTYNNSGRAAKQSTRNLHKLTVRVHNFAPLAIRSPSRGIATDAITPEDLYAFGAKHITKGLGRTTEGIMTKGEGSYVVYDDGRRMLDFTCGIGVTSLGKLYFPSRRWTHTWG
jgi:hypothetical protein